MSNTNKTSVGRIKSKNTSLRNKDREIQRLIEWLTLIKVHTLDGTILYLVDTAMEGRWPFGDEYKLDNSYADRM
jgi:hypothetical protein